MPTLLALKPVSQLRANLVSASGAASYAWALTAACSEALHPVLGPPSAPACPNSALTSALTTVL